MANCEICRHPYCKHAGTRRIGIFVDCANYMPRLFPRNNADRIRAMSDEELAEYIHAVSMGWQDWCDYHCENKGDDGCDNCILDWLKQPVKDGENG